MKVFIKDIAYYLPEKVLTNAQLAEEFPEWTTDKIAQKVGISERHISASDETVTDMAVRAAIKKIDQAAAKGILKKNTASRRKSSLARKLNASA